MVHRHRAARVLTFALMLLGVSWVAGCGSGDGVGLFDPEYSRPTLCVFLESGDPDVIAAVAADYGWTVVERYGEGRLALVRGPYDPDVLRADDRIVAFQRDARTEFSTPVELTMSFYEGDFDAELPTQDAFAHWNLRGAHGTSRGAGVKVAVLDTGVDPEHPLLAGRVRLLTEGRYSLGSRDVARGVDTNGNGLLDEAYGHGTHVAGTIATVAPDAEILAVRVLDSDGVGTAFDLARGLYRALDWGAQVINLSLVLSGESEVIEEAIKDLRNRKVVIVGAAGNSPGRPRYPASDSAVLSIAAQSGATKVASFSAAEGVRLAAPGVTVLSAYPGGRWASATGTSMACASASGALALVAALAEDVEDAVNTLRNTAIPLAPVSDGAIDLLSALAEAAER